jgi:ABC-type branched-subunit amino acid transport system substrate-binding protein
MKDGDRPGAQGVRFWLVLLGLVAIFGLFALSCGGGDNEGKEATTSAGGGAKIDALLALSYPQSASVYLKEAIENNLVKTFLFCDGDKSEDVIKAVGAENLEGMEGTVSAASAIPAEWQSEYEGTFGRLPPLPYIAESYDAVVMVALGAEKAQSTDPIAIRDAMRTLNDPTGQDVTSGATGIQTALDLIHQGKAINYQGASGFAGWDDNGDVPAGNIEVWKFASGAIETVRTEPVTLSTLSATKPFTPPANKTPGPLKIGILFDFTGDLAEYGGNMLNGANLALNEINAAGGILGQPIEFKQADSQTSPTVAVDAARQLVESDKVSAVIGSLSSGVTLAVAEGVTIPDKVILISPASTSPALTSLEDDDMVFRTTLSDAAQGPVLAELAQELGYKTVSTMYVNNAYGQGLSEEFTKAFEAAGGTVLAQVPHEQEQASYLAELQKAVGK